ncbi:MAG: hypothetical protein LLF76_07115 [Planctomycetaceae bacterium]|nr:hypothetical protein [Planctomycetaceae bacterium]
MKKVSIAVAVLIILTAWVYSERFMYVGSQEGLHYVMNKWTGKVYRIGTGKTELIGESGLSAF